MAEKAVTVLTNFLEVRRLLRFTRINTDKNQKSIKPMLRYISTSKINTLSDKIRHKYCSEIADISRQVVNNLKLLNHTDVLLNTHLAEPSNLHKKLQGQTQILIQENQELQSQTENVISNMSTKFKSPIQVVLADLGKRFKTKQYKLLSDGEDTWGVLTLPLKETLYCVITTKDNQFFLKTYIHEMPIDLNDNNSVEFKSPSQAYNFITKIIEEDGL